MTNIKFTLDSNPWPLWSEFYHTTTGYKPLSSSGINAQNHNSVIKLDFVDPSGSAKEQYSRGLLLQTVMTNIKFTLDWTVHNPFCNLEKRPTRYTNGFISHILTPFTRDIYVHVHTYIALMIQFASIKSKVCAKYNKHWRYSFLKHSFEFVLAYFDLKRYTYILKEGNNSRNF